MLAHCFVFHRDVRRVGWVPMQVQSTTKRTRIQHNYADTTVQGYPPLTGRVVDTWQPPAWPGGCPCPGLWSPPAPCPQSGSGSALSATQCCPIKRWTVWFRFEFKISTEA